MDSGEISVVSTLDADKTTTEWYYFVVKVTSILCSLAMEIFQVRMNKPSQLYFLFQLRYLSLQKYILVLV